MKHLSFMGALLMNGVSALTYGTPERFLAFLPSVVRVKRTAVYEKQAVRRYQVCTLILAFPAPRIERKKLLLIVSHLTDGIL